jgi:hypothetical protein
MPRKEETTICEFCRKGHVRKRKEDIAFRQWSDIGRISCRVKSRLVSAILAVQDRVRESIKYSTRPFSANMTSSEFIALPAFTERPFLRR